MKKTAFDLMHVSGFNPPAGHNKWGYTNGGDRVANRDGYPTGGIPVRMAKGGWIQDATKSIKKRGTKGKCTPITKPGCTGRAKALAKTFKKMAKKRKG